VAVSPEEFKACLGCRATAVPIVTSRAGDEIHGMTVSDFTSVSVDPPLVLVCAAKTAHTLEVIRAGKCFAVNILSAEQQELSNVFASKEREDTRFEGLETQTGITGAPLIPGARAQLDCSVHDLHDAGDHILCVGKVESVAIHEVEPLVYYQGSYRSFTSKDA
jgi:flavin reductase (DIM6/NTAB) family NADH-FMN oxidoreductase RutF